MTVFWFNFPLKRLKNDKIDPTLSDDDESYYSDADEQAASSSNRRTRPRNEISDESSDESLLSEDADSISDHGCFFMTTIMEINNR